MAKTSQQRKMGTCARRCKGKSRGGFRSCMKTCLRKGGGKRRRRKRRR